MTPYTIDLRLAVVKQLQTHCIYTIPEKNVSFIRWCLWSILLSLFPNEITGVLLPLTTYNHGACFHFVIIRTHVKQSAR